MNAYSMALFLHIAGVLGLAAALGLEWAGLRQIASATLPVQVGGWLKMLKAVRQVGFASMLATVLTGAYMTLAAWGGAAWIVVSMGALVLVIALALVLSGPRMAAIGRALLTAPAPQTFHRLAGDPVLWISIQTRIALTLGIVFLKTARPDWGGALFAIGVAIVLGIASALLASRRERAQPAPARSVP